MATTYLQLVNELLREFNENELTSANFADTRGVYSRAKDAINHSIREIGTYHHKWPFYAVEHTDTLVKGTYEYAWPTNFKVVDWNSFQIQIDAAVDITKPVTLKPIERDDFYRFYRDLDDQDTTNGRGVPKYVYNAFGDGYGISPNPDAAYTLTFRYWKYSTALSAATDEMDIPDQFKHVVLMGAAYHMYRMKDGIQYAQQVKEEVFMPALKAMRTLLINDDMYMSDGMTNPGSFRRSSSSGYWDV